MRARVRQLLDDRGHVTLAAVLTLGQVATAGTAFLVNLLSSSVLQPAERGVLALLLQVTYLGSVAVVLGLERPFMARIRSEFGPALHGFLRMSAWGYVICAVPAVAAVAFAIAHRYDLALALGCIAVYMGLNAAGKGVRVATVSSSKIRAFVIFTAVTQGVLLAISLVLVLLGVQDAIVWFAGYMVSGLLGLVVYLPASRSKSLLLEPSLANEIRHAGWKLLPASFGNTAMLRSDRLLLPVFGGFGELGIYAFVATAMEVTSWPIKQWVDTSLHRWAGRAGGRTSTKDILKLVAYAAAFSALLGAVLSLAMYFAITYLLSPDYGNAIDLIIPLALASIIYSVSRVQLGVLVAEARTGTVSIIETIGLIVSLIGYLCLIPLFGAMGAAWGSLIGYTATTLIAVFFMRFKGDAAL